MEVFNGFSENIKIINFSNIFENSPISPATPAISLRK